LPEQYCFNGSNILYSFENRNDLGAIAALEKKHQQTGEAEIKITAKKPLLGIILVFCLFSLVVFIFGYVIFNNEKESLLKDRYENLSQFTGEKFQLVTNWLSTIKSETKIIQIDNPLSFEGIKQARLNTDEMQWIDSVKRNLRIDKILLLDSGNKVIYSSGILRDAESEYNRTIFKEALNTGKIIFSDQGFRKSTRTDLRYYIPLLYPLGHIKKPMGVLILIFDSDKIFSNMLNISYSQSRTIESFVFRSSGDTIVYLNSSRFSKNGEKIKFPLGNKETAAVKAIKGDQGFIEGLDYKNDEITAYIIKVPATSWFLLTKINKSELFESVNAYAKVVFFMGMSADLIILIILVFLWRKTILSNYRKAYQAEMDKAKALINSESELRKLTAQIQFSREAERQNIAREVHDQLGQLFTGINLNVSYIMDLMEEGNNFDTKEVIKELTAVKSYIDQGVEKVRDISGKLRSYVLDHFGLVPALQEYCREIERIGGIKCTFECEPESIDLNDERNISLFRIIQEALTNILRHANATDVLLKILSVNNNLHITIKDNGVGMESEYGQQASMGFLGMKERAIFLGGTLHFDSGKGNGTTISLVIPLVNNKEDK
jgi:signal transduction histidine kinase